MRSAFIGIIACVAIVEPTQYASAQHSDPTTPGFIQDAVQWASAQKTFIQLVHNAIVADDPVRISELFETSDNSRIVPINANIGGIDNGATFLDYAAARCKAKAIEALIKLGGDPNVVYTSSPNQQSRTLSLAAGTCRELTDEPYIRKAISTFFTGQKRSNPNPVDASDSIARPQFHTFIEDCQRSNPTAGYLIVTEEWIKGGLKPGEAATPEQGGVTSLHVAAADLLHPVCKDIALALAQAATDQDFLKKDNKDRIPVDYTFGPARKQSKGGASGARIEYWIDCFAFSGDNSQFSQHQNEILKSYLSRNGTSRDLMRACGAAEANKPVTHFGIDTNGRKYIWQTRILPGNNGSATMDDPACDSNPGAWSSCQYLGVYPVRGVYDLAREYKLVWKELDPSCTQFDPRIPTNPITKYRFRECRTKCGISNAIYSESKQQSNLSMLRVAGLYKNWTNRSRCIGLLVYLK